MVAEARASPVSCRQSGAGSGITSTGVRIATLLWHGFRVAVMKADAVAPEGREAWVANRVKQGIDVMICHPRLCSPDLSLIDFTTLCWFKREFSGPVALDATGVE